MDRTPRPQETARLARIPDGCSRGPLEDTAGFTLVGLAVLIAVINIGLAVAVTSWATLDKRAREAELIWRGRQYARALQCHQQETGALPEKLDELLESDCIRALYPEPMSRDGQWRVIRESDLQLDPAAGGRRSAASMLDSIDRELRGPEAFFEGGGALGAGARGGNRQGPGTMGAQGAAGNLRQGSESLETAFERLRNLSERLRQDFGSSGNGIVGVASSSTAASLRLYEGESTYDAWRFTAR